MQAPEPRFAAFQQAQQMAQQQPQQQGQAPTFQNPLANAKGVWTLGNGSTVDDAYVAQLAQQHLGLPVAGVSPDGSAIQLQDGRSVPIPAIVQQVYQQPVTGFRPANADYSQVQPEMRAAMQTLPDDFRRKQYLEHYMQNTVGMQSPMIQGTGDDWFVFDPQSQKWIAATNAPGLDMGDVAGGAQTGLRLAGSIAGGALGAGAGMGPGSIAGGVAGAAAGGAGVDALTRGAWTMADPSYAAIMDQMGAGEVLADIGKGAAVDAAGALIPAAGGALLKGGLAPVSRMMAGAGGVAQNAGKVIGGIGRAADNGIGRDVAAAFIPGAAEAQLAGIGAQLPAMATRGAVKATGGIANTNFGRKLMGEEAAARAAQYANKSPSVTDIFGDLGESLGKRVGRAVPDSEAVTTWPFEALSRDIWRDKLLKQYGATGRTVGSKFGSAVQTIEDLGESAESVARAMAAPVTKGLRFGGGAMEYGGAAARRMGELGRGRGLYSLEDQLYGRLGAEEAVSRLGRASIDGERYQRPRPPTYLAGGY